MKKITALVLTVVFTVAFASFGLAFKKDVDLGDAGGKVVFSHEQHTETVKNKCNDCHTNLFQRKAGADEITMAAIKEGKFCGACHNGDTSFDASSEDNCGKCHQK